MRLKERLPIVYKLMRNKEIFNSFTNSGDDSSYDMFMESIELLMYEHTLQPDLRFGQFLINKLIVEDGPHWFLEEATWLIDNGHIEYRDIKFWGSISNNIKGWEESRPKREDEISIVEKVMYPYFKNFSEETVYEERLCRWYSRKPPIKYQVISKLSTDHIRNILLTQQVVGRLKEELTVILNERDSNN